MSCCHTPCVRRYITDRGVEVSGTSEAGCLGDADMERTRAIHASAPPRSTAIQWKNPGWQAGRYNVHMPFTPKWARCTDPANYCFRRAIEHAPTNLPADGSRLQHRYGTDRMLGADAMFRSPCFRFLRGIEPSILRLEGSAHPTGANVLGADMGVPPQRSIEALSNRNAVVFQCASSTRRLSELRRGSAHVPQGVAPCGPRTVRQWQPVPSGAGANVLRLEQRALCGTAIVVLDSALRRLGWTWPINAAQLGCASEKPPAHPRSSKTLLHYMAQPATRTVSHLCTLPVFDVRLLYYRGQLFATAVDPLAKLNRSASCTCRTPHPPMMGD